MSVLHAYLLPDLARDHDLARLIAACHAAMQPYPITLLPNDRLHTTVEMVADTSADQISSDERAELTTTLRQHLADTEPFEVTAGSPIANKAGAVLDLHPDDRLVDLTNRVRAALIDARGSSVLHHDGGRHHMSLGYSWSGTDGDPLQSALRRIAPSHAPFHVSHVYLLDVTWRDLPRPDGGTAWEIDWETVATIPLGTIE